MDKNMLHFVSGIYKVLGVLIINAETKLCVKS